MGMQFKLEQITPTQLDDFIRHPEKAYEWVLSDSFENPAVAEFLKMAAQQWQSHPEAKANIDHLANLLPATSKESAGSGLRLVRKLADAKREPVKSVVRKQLLLEKDWHVLHYVLNGTAEGGEGPIAKAILGGREIPDHQAVMGYGPVRYLRQEEVKVVAMALEAVNSQHLISKLDRQDAENKNIYLAHTFDIPAEWEYLPELFEHFREFYRDAAANGNGMLMEMY